MTGNKELTPDEFLKIIGTPEEQLKRRLQPTPYDIASGEGDIGARGLDLVNLVEQTPYQGIINTTERAAKNIKEGKIGAGTADIVNALIQGASTPVTVPFSFGQETLKKTAGEDVANTVSDVVNLPFTAIKKGRELTGVDLGESGNELFDLLGGLLITAGAAKGIKAIKGRVAPKEIATEIPKEVINENQNATPSEIPVEQRKSTIKPTEEQTQVGTPQRGSENIPEQKTPPASEGIKQPQEFTPKQIMSGDMPTPQAIGQAQRLLGKEFDSKLSDYMRQPENLSRIKEAKDPIRERAAIMEDFARKTLAANKMGIKDINADIVGEANKFGQKPPEQTVKFDEGAKKKLFVKVTGEMGQYPLNSPQLGAYRNAELPTTEVFKRLKDYGLIEDLKNQYQKLPIKGRDVAEQSQDFELMARIMLKKADEISQLGGKPARPTQTASTIPEIQTETGQGEAISQPGQKVTVQSLREMKGTGETKQRGLSKTTEASAIEAGILNEIKDLPEYKTLKNDVEIPKAAVTINNTPQKALNIVKGTEKAPSLPQLGFIYKGLEAIATSKNPVPEVFKQLPQYKGMSDLEIKANLANELATSTYVSKQGTTAGQFIQSLKGQNDLSSVKAIQDIVKAREENFAQKTGREGIEKTKERVVEQIKTQTSKNNLKFKDWNDFINSLVCK